MSDENYQYMVVIYLQAFLFDFSLNIVAICTSFYVHDICGSRMILTFQFLLQLGTDGISLALSISSSQWCSNIVMS